MKRENVFETDTPTQEMETQTLRPSQQGQPTNFINGIPLSQFPGYAMQSSTPFQLQSGLTSNNGYPQQFIPTQIAPQYYPGAIHPQPIPYANNIQPYIAAPFAPGYFANAFPTPYMTNPHPGFIAAPSAPIAQGPLNAFQYQQPYQTPFAGTPVTHPNYGTSPMQAYPTHQPAINLADGQVTFLPQPYTPSSTRNGSTYPKNSERDFISWFPNVNILETDKTFKIEICVPGVTRENCRINVEKDNILRISGTRRWNQETDAVGFTRKDFNYGSFACSFVLTNNLQKEKITSSCRNGLLIISIPKQEQPETEERNFSEISVN
jgi:HSP20 family protein